jgi:hypothetical protein
VWNRPVCAGGRFGLFLRRAIYRISCGQVLAIYRISCGQVLAIYRISCGQVLAIYRISCVLALEVSDGVRPIANLRCTLVTFWIFKSPVYKGFRSPVFEVSPGHRFPTIARGAPILLGFLQFRCLLEPPF